MSRHSSDWEGKAILVALSIDDAQADAARHVESKGWTAIRHFWSAAGSEPGWNSDAPRTYGIDGIPTAFLIDTDGKILWRGNPRQVEVEEMISEQLAR
jgi:hypothetical protein